MSGWNPVFSDGQWRSFIGEAELQAELAAIEAEAMGWLPLGEGAYLHLGELQALADDGAEREIVITVVGIPDEGMVAMTVLLLT